MVFGPAGLKVGDWVRFTGETDDTQIKGRFGNGRIVDFVMYVPNPGVDGYMCAKVCYPLAPPDWLVRLGINLRPRHLERVQPTEEEEYAWCLMRLEGR